MQVTSPGHESESAGSTAPSVPALIDSGLVGRKGEVSRGEKMLYSGTDPESYITEYTLACEDIWGLGFGVGGLDD